MKIIKYFSFAAIINMTVLFCSCSHFLEVETLGKVTIPNFFSDMDGARSAVAGMYSLTYNYYSTEFYKYPEVAGNMLDIKAVTSSSDMINQYNFTSDPEQSTTAVGHIWQKIYQALANANNIIQYQPSLLAKYPTNADELKTIMAQSLFIRALCHFDLCRVYAQPYNYTNDASHLGVPVLRQTPGPDDNVARASVKEVYDFIKSDLLAAEQLFGTTTMDDAYHASKLSVEALLSRVYLYSGDWTNAITYSTSVINSLSLSAGDSYINMFTKLNTQGESIFRLNGTLKSTSLGLFYAPSNPVAIAADTLVTLFDNSADIRLQLFKLLDGTTKYATLKYFINATYTTKEEHYDPIVLRVSEMYLNRAEAYLNNNDLPHAAADLKVIIARALKKNVTDITVPENDKTALAALIYKERVKELCFEGHNFFDIVRQKMNLKRCATTNSNVKFKAYPNDWFVLPIPQDELDANTNMKGNPTVNK
jgi:starch-binding outer membrane protein, SusD/RagB family